MGGRHRRVRAPRRPLRTPAVAARGNGAADGIPVPALGPIDHASGGRVQGIQLQRPAVPGLRGSPVVQDLELEASHLDSRARSCPAAGARLARVSPRRRPDRRPAPARKRARRADPRQVGRDRWLAAPRPVRMRCPRGSVHPARRPPDARQRTATPKRRRRRRSLRSPPDGGPGASARTAGLARPRTPATSRWRVP